jgi:DNA-binding SARP family transcriptional activator
MLHVRLLGGFALRVGDSPATTLDSARAESLLAFLLLHRDSPCPRQQLAFLLWPDSTEPQARTNLRHVLHNLRRSVPEADRFIDVRPRMLQWRTQASMWLDVAVFEQAVTEGRLQDAVESYTGDLLEGIYDDWVLEERERLARLHVDSLEQLTRELEAEHRWPQAIRYAERPVRQDPLREETYRLLMRLYDASGDHARAVRVFHVCAATLQRELGVQPAAATRAAYEALLPAAPGPQALREPAAPAGPALVGRTAERAQLTAVWKAALRGSAQVVLVTGEPGIGKSRLVEELRLWCGQGGAATAEARAYPAEGAMAYGLVATWLRSEVITARLGHLDRADLSELARLLPELLADVPDLVGPEPLPESEQRHRLFRAIVQGILVAGSPLRVRPESERPMANASPG